MGSQVLRYGLRTIRGRTGGVRTEAVAIVAVATKTIARFIAVDVPKGGITGAKTRAKMPGPKCWEQSAFTSCAVNRYDHPPFGTA